MGVAAVTRPDRSDLSLQVRIRFIRGGWGIRNPLFSRPCASVSPLCTAKASVEYDRLRATVICVFVFVFMPISGVRRTSIDNGTIVIGADPLLETLFPEHRTQRNKSPTQRDQTFYEMYVMSVFLKSYGWTGHARGERTILLTQNGSQM